MSDKPFEAKRPKVTRFFVRDAVHLGGSVKQSLSAGELASSLERTPGGILVRYEQPDGKGAKVKRSSFIPDANVLVMDLEEGAA